VCLRCSYLWQIPVTWRTSRGHAGFVWLRDRETTFDLPEPLHYTSSAADSADWIKLNHNETGYFRVNYMPSNWRALSDALRHQHQVPSAGNCSSARYDKKGRPSLITERRVPELIPVLGSQPASDVSHKPGGRLQLLSARPAVTPATLTNFAAW